MESAHARAFLADAVCWCRTAAEAPLLRLIRSSCSGVPHDVGAAYATLASRTGSLLDAILRGRLALPSSDRDAVLRFAERARLMSANAAELGDDELRDSIRRTFALSTSADARLPAAPDGEIALAASVAPEERHGVAAWQRHFSASALNAYTECARKWFYRYACAAIEDRGSAASAYGTAFHLALEDFHGEFPRPRSGDEQLMRRRVREYVTWAFERNRDGFDTHVEFDLQVRRAQRTAQRYVDWLIAQAQAAPFDVVGREVPANLELGGHAFVGFIDRLDRDERSGSIGVVDYKTGSIATSAAEYRDKVRRYRDFQLPFYYWARTAAGDTVTQLMLLPLKDALHDVRPISLTVARGGANRASDDAASGTITPDELERARNRMIELSGELASGAIEHFAPTTDPASCTYCAYATACAYKPPAAPERFAR